MVGVPAGLGGFVVFGLDPAPAHHGFADVAHGQFISPGVVVVGHTPGGQLGERYRIQRVDLVDGLLGASGGIVAIAPFAPLIGRVGIGAVLVVRIAFARAV